MSTSCRSVLFLYNATQTYTNTVWEHLECFRRYSRHRVFYAHLDVETDFQIDLGNFDAVLIHYSVRFPYDQLSDSSVAALQAYQGIKGAFQQDEYEATDKIRAWIERLDLGVLFTVVPECNVATIYDPAQFPRTRFVSSLTGYVPMDIGALRPPVPLGERRVMIGYRGRPLAYWYGALGQEKTFIARRMRAECEERGIPVDIEWTEEARIYGDGWYDFLSHCRAVLGTESGSNLFDDDGSIRSAVTAALRDEPGLTYAEAERRFFPGRDRPGLMNQVSPRIFEAAALKVALVLFEGDYSGVVEPGRHFIPLKKDFSNVDEVLRLLGDDEYIEALTQRTLEDLVLSGRYGYALFVGRIDRVLDELAEAREAVSRPDGRAPETQVWSAPATLTTAPLRARPAGAVERRIQIVVRLLIPLWSRLPQGLQDRMKPILLGLLGRVRGR